MPVVDGVEAARLVRGIQELCGAAIVAFSAFGGNDYSQRVIEAACDEYVNQDTGHQQANKHRRPLPEIC